MRLPRQVTPAQPSTVPTGQNHGPADWWVETVAGFATSVKNEMRSVSASSVGSSDQVQEPSLVRMVLDPDQIEPRLVGRAHERPAALERSRGRDDRATEPKGAPAITDPAYA